ncbi:MAG: F0F1 ATP synthase subunit delta [Candidatus Lambdaproteobacteria bacterium]|nr:F0F1 ATP synthase subunit delta [Candidatus Lambdaproteobacteria bacterium]
MEFSWTTFLLEAVNFLVLVWLLQRFLYRPVSAAIAQRRQAIRAGMDGVEQARREADDLRRQALRQVEAWEQQRQERLDALFRELAGQRERMTAELDAALGEERHKAEAAERQRRAETERRYEERALRQGSRFAARLLEALAGAELEARLAQMVIAELERLPEARRRTIRATFASGDRAAVEVKSAFPLDAALEQRLTLGLRESLGEAVPVEYATDPTLLAGLRVSIGYWVLHANLKDELRFFAEAATGGE